MFNQGTIRRKVKEWERKKMFEVKMTKNLPDVTATSHRPKTKGHEDD